MELSLYPNPTKQKLNISVNFPERRITSVSVYDQFGNIIYYSDKYQSYIEFENEVEGIYILKLQLKTKSLFEKFVFILSSFSMFL